MMEISLWSIRSGTNFVFAAPFPIEDLAAAEERIKMAEKERVAEQKVQMLSTTQAMLRKFHRLLNQELAALLDDERFTWPELAQTLDANTQNDQVSSVESFRQSIT